MSVMLASNCKNELDKIYLNELLLLKPISPDMPPEIINAGSHVQTVMTIYFSGIKPKANRGDYSGWNFELYQPGIVDSLDLGANETLFEPDSFYNHLINLDGKQPRQITGVSLKKGEDKSLLERKVSLYWGKALGSKEEPEQAEVFKIRNFNSLALGKTGKREVGIILEKHPKENYSKFIIFGNATYNFIFRFSYINPVAKEPNDSNDPHFDINNILGEKSATNSSQRRFYTSEKYLLKSPYDVKEQIRGSLSKIEREALDDTLIETNLHQDLTIAPRPHHFIYSYFLSSFVSSNEVIQDCTVERTWKEKPLSDKKVYVLNIMPQSQSHYKTSFQLPITAQLQCPSCLFFRNASQIQQINNKLELMNQFVGQIIPKDKEKDYQEFLKNLNKYDR